MGNFVAVIFPILVPLLISSILVQIWKVMVSQPRLRNEEEGVAKLRRSLTRKTKHWKLTDFTGRLLLETQRVFQRNLGHW